MKIRVAWVSPFTPLSGVGTFARALVPFFDSSAADEDFEFTILRSPTERPYSSSHRTIRLWDSPEVADVLSHFDLIIYSLGNNSKHHGLITRLLEKHPGVVILHDYVYQHFLAGICFDQDSSPSYAALMSYYYGQEGMDVVEGSGIASINGQSLYTPWESAQASRFPLSEPLMGLASGLIVHSQFAESYVRPRFSGPVCRLFMPHDQKTGYAGEDWQSWSRLVLKPTQLHALSFGHLNPTKHLEAVLAAIAASDSLRREMHLTVAGHASPEYRARLEKLAKRYAIERNVSFEYSVSEQRLQQLIGRADLFVNLRWPNTEGASASLAEQMHIGKPSVIFASGSYAEIPADACIQVQDRSSSSIMHSLEDVVSHREALVEKGRKAREVSVQNDSKAYMKQLRSFVSEHYDVLRSRGTHTDLVHTQGLCSWERTLNESRSTMLALQQGWLPCVAALGLEKRNLSRYFALTLIGVDASPILLRSLDGLLLTLEDARLYRLGVLTYLVSAVVRSNAKLTDRLNWLVPVFDVDLWKVILALPSDLFQQWSAIALGMEIKAPASQRRRGGHGLSRSQVLLDLLNSSFSVAGSLDPRAKSLATWLMDDEWAYQLPVDDLEVPFLALDEWYSFKTSGSASGPLLQGFHQAENEGTWSAGRVGRLLFRLVDTAAPVITVTLRINPHGAELKNRVLTLRDGLTGIETHVTMSSNQITEASIALEAEAQSRLRILIVRINEVFRPSRFGSSDSRSLGIFLNEMMISA